MAQERAVLAGGCFWGMQDLIRKLPGVQKTRVGYTGAMFPMPPTVIMALTPKVSKYSLVRMRLPIAVSWSSFFRYMIQPPPAGRAMTVARLIVRRFTT